MQDAHDQSMLMLTDFNGHASVNHRPQSPVVFLAGVIMCDKQFKSWLMIEYMTTNNNVNE